MAEENSNSITDFAAKFMQVALDLGDVQEVVYHQAEDSEEKEDNGEEFSLVGKKFIEGKMGLTTVEKFLGSIWDFISSGDAKVFELDNNIMEFRFKDEDTRKKVFDSRPWSINGYLINFRYYNSEVIYQEMDWSKQCFWIQIKKIFPEHMNVKAITKIGKLMGSVMAIEPEDGVPVGGDPVKPHKICPKCYIINHTKGACKAAADYLVKTHAKPHFFGEVRKGKGKQIVIARNGDHVPIVSKKEANKGITFVPPKDGYVVSSASENAEGYNIEGERLGKRQRNDFPVSHVFEQGYNSNGNLRNTQTTHMVTARDINQCNTKETEVPILKFHLNFILDLSYLSLKMKIVSWNVQGIANNFTKQQFQNLVKTQNSDFIFLCETKIDESRMMLIAQYVHYYNFACIDREGMAGGLVLMWKDGIDVEVIGCENNIIHALIQLYPSKPQVLISFMYGSTYTKPKKTQWNCLCEFSKDIQLSWLVIGDLNFHLDCNSNTSDKWVQYRVNDAGLIDIGYEGKDYTWTSNSFGTGTRKARLDMALSNNDRSINFSSAKLLHLNFIASDHCPVLLIKDPIPKHLWRPFKFFRTWIEHETFKEKFENSWNVDVYGSLLLS
ncbi:uncharacterized protein LOC113339624 [Papaver somniferum]|uniref:uncharacterized protein LOC113339624 n=1 Tax=Papaver somniferum TaxID=3469 RepID=UPI000E6FE0AE|nr:uncharacterized protein LOC113339624 [Papaver somniferum]